MAALVSRTIRRHRLLVAGDRVAVAVSGGADSVALTWLLAMLAPRFGATLAGLVHVNHGLRGAESDADEAFCRALSARAGLPIDVVAVDVRAHAQSRRMSIEAAARDLRYAAFAGAATRLGATRLATGHTEDDQAETVLLRLLRGAGTRGLSGIRVSRGAIVRPLIDTTRADLRRFLRARHEAWREDSSNDDLRVARNRVRRELMPVVEAIAPGGVSALARLAALAADDEAALEAAARRERAALVTGDDGRGRVVPASALTALPPAVARRLVRLVAADVAPGRGLSARHIEAVCRLAATDKPEGRADLPGLAVTREAGRLVFAEPTVGRRRPSPEPAWPVRRLDVPGTVTVPEAGVVIAARRAADSAAEVGTGDRQAVIDAEVALLPLLVRNRRAGDRFQPLGAPGRRKVQDVMVDRRIPRAVRDRVPVVTDAAGEILWVAGVALAERCRIRAAGRPVLLLELRNL